MDELPRFPDLPARIAELLDRPGREWPAEVRRAVAAWVQQEVLLILVDRWLARRASAADRNQLEPVALEAADRFLSVLAEPLGPLDRYEGPAGKRSPGHFFEHLEKSFTTAVSRTRRAASARTSEPQVIELQIAGSSDDPFARTSRLFDEEGGLIGRHPDNDLVLSDQSVSRFHARIRFDDGAFRIEDAGSVNGVSVNLPGNKLAPGQSHVLHSGDLILIEPYALRVTVNPRVIQYLDGPPPRSRPAPADRPDVFSMPGSPPLSSPSPAPLRHELARIGGEQPQGHEWLAWPEGAGRAPADVGVEGEPVEAAVFGPSKLARGHSRLIQVFVHRVGRGEEARAAATETDDAAKRLGYRTLAVTIPPGTVLTFVLSAPKLQIEEAVLPLTWSGRTEAVAFTVTVPEDAMAGMVIGTVSVSANSVPIGHIKFQLEIVPAVAAMGAVIDAFDPLTTGARRYRKAFISYASKDRNRVLARVQMLRPLGVEYVQDVMSLSPGDRWAKELYRHIDSCDVFYLFWSSNAKASKWVLKELQYAHDRKRDDDDAPPKIQPVPIEGPPPVSPPAGFEWLHVDDPVLYFKVADQPDV